MSETLEERLHWTLRRWRVSPKQGCELAEPLDARSDHVVGDPAAPLAIVEYGSYSSPAGARHDRALRAPLRELLIGGRIRFGLRQFPLIDASPHALLAARAVEAADAQGRFWDLHEAISRSLAEASTTRPVQGDGIVALAGELGLDVERLERDTERPEVAQRILRDVESGVRSGVNGTPCLYVAGIRQLVDKPEELLTRLERALGGDHAALWPPVRTSPQQASHERRPALAAN